MSPQRAATRLATLGARDFRSYAHFDLAFDPGPNMLYGPNGSGKTNLLEAIAYISLSRSPRTPRDRDLIRHSATAFKLRARYDLPQIDAGSGTVEVDVSASGHKRVVLDGRPVRPTAMYGTVPMVWFTPDDLWMLKAGPAQRRAALDRLLVQESPLYGSAWHRYTRAIRQRNAVLRDTRARRSGTALLETWLPQLVQYGAELLDRRSQAVGAIVPLAAMAYAELSAARESLDGTYLPGLGRGAAVTAARSRSDWERLLRDALRDHLQVDMAAGITTVGPHRDDVELTINGLAARQFASQGQQRSAVLAWKFAERSHLAAVRGQLPVLLVDDVLSELDAGRRDALHRMLVEEGQVFLTTADRESLPRLGRTAEFRVEAGTAVRLS